jgi:hypothetical protein
MNWSWWKMLLALFVLAGIGASSDHWGDAISWLWSWSRPKWAFMFRFFTGFWRFNYRCGEHSLSNYPRTNWHTTFYFWFIGTQEEWELVTKIPRYCHGDSDEKEKIVKRLKTTPGILVWNESSFYYSPPRSGRLCCGPDH